MADTWEYVPGSAAGTYTDDLIFEVDWETKELQKILGQTLIAGEENSQYIRFQAGRYYDGIDLSEKQIYIVFALEKSYFGKTLAVSVERNEENIRFGWIVPKTACATNGTLEFFLKFTTSGYVLKTKSTKVTVEESKEEDDLIPEPTTEAWYKEFQARVDESISSAEAAVSTASDIMQRAESAATAAQRSAGSAAEAKQSAEESARKAQINYGSPLRAGAAAEMTETGRVYVYAGSEDGYAFGHWYYHDGYSWIDGGVYNAVEVGTDKTLTVEDEAADSAIVGAIARAFLALGLQVGDGGKIIQRLPAEG
jgi:hypothetical protein